MSLLYQKKKLPTKHKVNLQGIPAVHGIRQLVFEAYDAVEVGVEASEVAGGVVVGGDGGDGGVGGSSSQWFQTLLIPHVGSSRAAAVGRGQVQGGAALRVTSRSDTPPTNKQDLL